MEVIIVYFIYRDDNILSFLDIPFIQNITKTISLLKYLFDLNHPARLATWASALHPSFDAIMPSDRHCLKTSLRVIKQRVGNPPIFTVSSDEPFLWQPRGTSGLKLAEVVLS